MAEHRYYPIEHLQILKKIEPELFAELTDTVAAIHTLCVEYPDILFTAFPDLMGYLDLTDVLSEQFHAINKIFKQRVGKTFFLRITDYNFRKTKVLIALTIYEDLHAGSFPVS